MRQYWAFALALTLLACAPERERSPMEVEADRIVGDLKAGRSAMQDTVLPSYQLRCDFAHRSICSGGQSCTEFDDTSGTYVLIDGSDMTYRRCDGLDGCDTHRIEAIGSPAPVLNISLGSKGMIAKYGPNDRFVEVATMASMIYVSDGTCRPN